MQNSRKKTVRYDTSGQWFKGNTHIHSTASDGGMEIADIAEMYAGAGYDFIFFTDHWVCSDVADTCRNAPLLVMDGLELDGTDGTGAYYHVVCLGKTAGIVREDGFEAALGKARSQGAILVLAHPYWLGNTMADANRWAFDGVEIYNHVCRWLNGKDDGRVHWDAMLRENAQTLAFAVDDAHLKPEHPGWNGGWIMINAPELSTEAVLSAIRSGNYYSTCGPQFKSITYDGQSVHIECSPVQFIRLVGPSSNGLRSGSFDGSTLSNASFEIPADWSHAYLEIEDAAAKRAWSNTLFVSDGRR